MWSSLSWSKAIFSYTFYIWYNQINSGSMCQLQKMHCFYQICDISSYIIFYITNSIIVKFSNFNMKFPATNGLRFENWQYCPSTMTKSNIIFEICDVIQFHLQILSICIANFTKWKIRLI